MAKKTIDDPVFGKLTWEDGAWAGSFGDAHFATWGEKVVNRNATITVVDPQKELERFRSGVSPETREQSELFRLMEATLPQMLEDQASLEAKADRLLKVGRFKIVVRCLSDPRYTAALREAWQQFRDGGEALYNQISERLLMTYQAQRPERLRWWAKIYGDSADRVLPEVSSAAELHGLMWPTEFRVHPDSSGKATVTIAIDALWTGSYGDGIQVKVQDGALVRIGPVTEFKEPGPQTRTIQSPVFGSLKWRDDVWRGTFHCDELRGFLEASELRHRFATWPEVRMQPRREMPPWDVITGDFALRVEGNEDVEPSPAQEATYREFTRNLPQNAWLTLAACLHWYQQIRPNWLRDVNDEDMADTQATIPVIETPEGMLDIIQLQSLTVGEKPEDDRPPAIVLSFCWFDEHGLEVLWRGGQVQNVGTCDEIASSF